MAVTSFGSAAGGLQPYEQVFTSSGTWTKPAGVKTVEVITVGGGSNSTSGGAGAYYKGTFNVSSLASVPVTVGASMGASSFGTFVVCPGSTNYNAGRYYFPTVSGAEFVPTPTSQTMSGTPYNDGKPYQQSEDGTYSVSFVSSYYGGTEGYGIFPYKSFDGGVTWNGAGSLFFTGTSYQPKPISYGQANGLWVQWADYINYYTSTDGTNATWVKRNYPLTHRVSGMNYANGKWWVFFSSNGSTTTHVGWSTDCINWSTSAVTFVSNENRDLRNIVYWGGYYWSAGLSGSAILGYYSTDGITWTRQGNYNGDTPNTYQFEMFATSSGVVMFPLGNGTIVKYTGTTTGQSVACNKYAFGVVYKDGLILADTSGYYLSLSSETTLGTWTDYGNNGNNSQNVGIAGGVLAGNYYNGTSHQLMKFAGYAGQAGGFYGSTYGGAGAGGNGAPGSQSFSGPGIEGLAAGGCSSFTGAPTYGGGANNAAPGGQGIVKVRWYA